MGVWGLNNFIRGSVQNGYFLVNIKDEIDKWKSEHQNTEPIIVFDFLCLSYHVSNEKYDYFSGGRHNLIIEDFRSFFKTIKEFGAKLIFFIDGSLQDDKYQIWCNRHDKKYGEMIDILTDIYIKKSNKEMQKKFHSKMRPLISTVISALINVAKEFGEMKKTYNVECDMAIVDYAGKNNAMAVVGDDTDFIIFEGNWKFWSTIDLNMQNITTMEYNKIGLRKQINLSIKKMPIFAVIYGQGYMDIKKRGQSDLNFNNAIQYIKQFPNELQNSDIMKIVNDSYNNNMKYGNKCVLQDIEQTVRYSLNSYNMANLLEFPQLKDELLINAFNDDDGYIFEILKNLPIKITVLYFDYRKDDFKNYYDLIERLLCRQMGVLLKHKNKPKLTRRIITKKSHDEHYQEYLVKPEYPSIEIPFTLNEFLFDKELDKNIRWIKYSLLCWIITDVVKPEKLLKIPKEYLVTVLTLIYLRENGQISLEEADAILLSIKFSENIIDDFQPTDNTNEKAFRLAFLFTKLYGHIKRCVCYVGLKDLIGDLRFDGMYFQKVYVDFCVTKMDRKEYAKSIKKLKKYRLYTFNC